MRYPFNIILIASIVVLKIAILYFSVPKNKEESHLKNASWHEVITPHDFKYPEAENLSVKAFNLKNEEQLDEAINIYQQAIQIEPDNPKLYFDISECYARKNLLRVAIAKLDSAIMVDPTYTVFFNNRGFYYYQIYEDEKAISDFEKAIQLDNTLPNLYYNLSMCYYAKNRFDEACNAFHQAKKLGLDIDSVKKQKEYKLLSELCK